MAGIGSPSYTPLQAQLEANNAGQGVGQSYFSQLQPVSSNADPSGVTSTVYNTPNGNQVIQYTGGYLGNQFMWADAAGNKSTTYDPSDQYGGLAEITQTQGGPNGQNWGFNGSAVGSSGGASVGQPTQQPGTPVNPTTPDPNAAAKQAASTAVLAPQAQLPTQDYVNQVTQSLQPTFTSQEQTLAENLAGMGILNSGAANKVFQDLTGQQSATIAGLVAPLLAQGNSQQFQTNNSNADRQNSMIQQANQLSEQTGLANLGSAQALQLAQLGFANSDQNTLINAIYGLTGGNQQAINQIAANSVGQGSQAYQGGIQTTLPYLNQAGQGAGYGSGPYLGGGVGPETPGFNSYIANTETTPGYNVPQEGGGSSYTGVGPPPGIS